MDQSKPARPASLKGDRPISDGNYERLIKNSTGKDSIRGQVEHERSISREALGWSNVKPMKVLSDLRCIFRARALAPISTAEIDNAIASAVGDEPWLMTGERLGQLIEFTFDEYRRCGRERLGRTMARHVSTIRPVDASPEEIRRYLVEFHKPARMIKARERRATKKAEREAINARFASIDDITPRMRALHLVLTDKWISVRQAATKIRRSPAWKRPDGRMMELGSIVRRINVMITQDDLQLEVRTEVHFKGFGMRRIRINRHFS